MEGAISSEAKQTGIKRLPLASGSQALDDSGYETGRDSNPSELKANAADMPCDKLIMETNNDASMDQTVPASQMMDTFLATKIPAPFSGCMLNFTLSAIQCRAAAIF